MQSTRDISAMVVLVLGATGRFSSLVKALLERGHRVRAATRDPGSAKAKMLQSAGAQIVRVDLDDPDSIEAAAAGADAVFAAGTSHAAGFASEVKHGRAIVDAVESAGGVDLVYVSVAGAGKSTGVPLFESKRRVEDYIAARSVPASILAPVYLMENIWNPWNAAVLDRGRFPTPVAADRPLQQIALADVVSFARHALERRSELVGTRIELASDELTAYEAAATVGELVGRTLDVEQTVNVGPVPLFAWLDRVGYSIDVDALRRRFPDVGWHRYRDWARIQDWSILAGRVD